MPKELCMADTLVVVDSKEKAAALQEQYETELETLLVLSPPVKASYVVPEDKLKKQALSFSFTALPSEKSFIDKLREGMGKEIYLALDCDHRGEYLSWLISEYIVSSSKGATVPKRLHLTGLTKEELEESFRFVASVESDMATTYYVRSLFFMYLNKHLQRLLGTQAGPGNLPLNFHSLTALFLLDERENEIKMYAPTVKWQVMVKLSTAEGEFFARMEEVYGITDDGFLKDAQQGKEVVNKFKGKPFKVNKISKSEITVAPPAPFRLSELLQEAYTEHSIEPKKVLETLRKLFYGVEVKGSVTGLISSFVVLKDSDPSGIIERIQDHIAEVFGEDALADEENIVEAGEDSLLPLRPEVSEDELKNVLDETELKLYGLIRGRAMASRMQKATGEDIDVEFGIGGEFLFRSTLRTVTEKAYMEVYQGPQDKEYLKPCPLAALEEGQAVDVKQIIPEQTVGFPPEYYTFESLFTDLVDFSMPLDPMTILMIQSMLDCGYIFIAPDGSIRPKENTTKVINTVNRAFPTMTGINLSAYLEQTIGEAVSGRKALDFALKQFDQTFIMQGKVLVKVAVPLKRRTRPRTSRSVIKIPEPKASEEISKQFNKLQQEMIEKMREEGRSLEEAQAVVAREKAVQEIPAEEVPEKAEPEAVTVEAPAPPAEGAAEEAAPSADEPAIEAEAVQAEEAVPDLTEMEEELAAPEAAPAEEVSEEVQELFDEAPPEESAPPPEPAAIPQEAEEGETKECSECGRSMLLKNDRFGKYWTCSGYPACRHAESFEKKEAALMECPLCHVGNVVSKLTPTGKPFYVCPEADCEFIAWSQPYMIPCQTCNSPFLVEKKNIKGQVLLRCPRAGCNYMQTKPGEDYDEDVLDVPAEETDGVTAAAAPAKKKRKVRIRRRPGSTASASSGGKKKVRVVRRKK